MVSILFLSSCFQEFKKIFVSYFGFSTLLLTSSEELLPSPWRQRGRECPVVTVVSWITHLLWNIIFWVLAPINPFRLHPTNHLIPLLPLSRPFQHCVKPVRISFSMWGTFLQQTDKWSLQDYVIIFSFSALWCSFCFYVLWIFWVSPSEHLYHEGNINLMARVEFLLKVVKIKEVWMYFLCKRDLLIHCHFAFSPSVYQISLLSKDSPRGLKRKPGAWEGRLRDVRTAEFLIKHWATF